jgi:hypothetical protein
MYVKGSESPKNKIHSPGMTRHRHTLHINLIT